MPNYVFVAFGLVVGLVIGWGLASARTHRGAKARVETKVGEARAVEHLKQSVAADVDRKTRELAELKNKYDEDHQATANARAKLEADLSQVREKTDALRTELQTTVDENFREVGQFYDISTSLERALQAYTQAVEAVEARLLAATKRLRALGISMGTPVSTSASTALKSGAEEPPPQEPPAHGPAAPARPATVQSVKRSGRLS